MMEEKLRQLWGDRRLTVHDIARRLSISTGELRERAKSLGLPRRMAVTGRRVSRHPDPTQDELDRRCAAVRAKRKARDESPPPVEVVQYGYDKHSGSFYAM